MLLQQPLCVCHLQELLDLPQVNVSQHLAYLRKNGLVEFTSVQTWKVYRLRSPMSRAVELSLRCLAESAKSDSVLSSDLKRLPKALKSFRFSSCGDPTVDQSRRLSQQSVSHKVMSSQKKFKILFLCTGNTARSIFGEYLIRRRGQGRFESYSAGADPKAKVNPYALSVLRDAFKIDASAARSKSWDEYRDVVFDFVITVCDNAKERCPFWPGQPIIAHWPAPDPVEFKGNDKETYDHFWKVAQQLYRRIDLFCNLPMDKLDRLLLEQAMKEIGTSE